VLTRLKLRHLTDAIWRAAFFEIVPVPAAGSSSVAKKPE
jgi:hypothetical protein